MKLIGLTGKSRVGKDTVASVIQGRIDSYSETYAFADPIRRMLAQIGVAEAMYGDLKEQPVAWLGKSPRELMQTLGTEWGRNLIAEDIWLRLADRAMRDQRIAGTDVCIVTDVRMTNEAHWVKNQGGLLIKITREDREQVRPHSSENGIPDRLVDHLIENNGSLGELGERVEDILGREGLL